MSRGVRSGLVLALAMGLAACSEKPQAGHPSSRDSRAFDGPATAYTAAGWKAGDATAWETQLRARAQGQNEYSRSGSPP